MIPPIEMIARETRAKALERERLQSELTNVRAQIAVEHQSLSSIMGLVAINKEKLGNLRNDLSDLSKRDKFLAKLRETLNVAILSKMSLDTFYENVEPSPQEQDKQCELLKTKYEEMLTSYKTNPEYLRYLDAQAKEKELEQRITEIKTEVMRLEAAETGCVELVESQ